MPVWFSILCQVSILAYAVLAGVFLAFSDFIMRSFANTSGAGGIEAMQVINREVFRFVFMTLFLGMAPVSLAIAGYGAVQMSGGPAAMTVSAGVLYLVAAFGTTVAFNVPLNEAPAKRVPDAEETRHFWMETYLPRWTFWNSVRALACLCPAALLLCATYWMTQIS